MKPDIHTSLTPGGVPISVIITESPALYSSPSGSVYAGSLPPTDWKGPSIWAKGLSP